MAVITRINGIPLFSSIRGALRWGKFNRLKGGYHVHYWEGKKGYMGGDSHSEIAKRRPVKIDPIIAARHEANSFLQRTPTRSKQSAQPVQPILQLLEQPILPTTSETTSSGNTGGGGGY